MLVEYRLSTTAGQKNKSRGRNPTFHCSCFVRQGLLPIQGLLNELPFECGQLFRGHQPIFINLRRVYREPQYHVRQGDQSFCLPPIQPLLGEFLSRKEQPHLRDQASYFHVKREAMHRQCELVSGENNVNIGHRSAK